LNRTLHPTNAEDFLIEFVRCWPWEGSQDLRGVLDGSARLFSGFGPWFRTIVAVSPVIVAVSPVVIA